MQRPNNRQGGGQGREKRRIVNQARNPVKVNHIGERFYRINAILVGKDRETEKIYPFGLAVEIFFALSL
jgi:hypothetical protein